MRKFILLFAILFSTLFGVKAQNQFEVIPSGNAAANNKVPLYGWYFESKQKSQMLYRKSWLSPIEGKTITKLIFYTNTGNMNYNGPLF